VDRSAWCRDRPIHAASRRPNPESDPEALRFVESFIQTQNRLELQKARPVVERLTRTIYHAHGIRVLDSDVIKAVRPILSAFNEREYLACKQACDAFLDSTVGKADEQKEAVLASVLTLEKGVSVPVKFDELSDRTEDDRRRFDEALEQKNYSEAVSILGADDWTAARVYVSELKNSLP
jgi:hypothetical protein